jgi:16S rRNA (cytosine967-C5)-methyltransferase
MLSTSAFKLHRPVAFAIIHCLEDIINVQKPVDKVLEKCFKLNPKLGKRDRAFIAENVYDITRHFISITYAVPQNDDLWSILGAWLLLNKHTLPEWKEFKALDDKAILSAYKEGLKQNQIKYSVPADLDIFGKEQLADRWYKELEAMDHPASMVLRVNTLKADRNQVTHYLDEILVKYKLLEHQQALIVDQRINLFSSPIFKNGWIEVQDYASQQVGYFANPSPGERIIDACAGGGGKAIHLATIMRNKGRIIALDIDDHKLGNLKIRARRAGVQILEARWIENNKVIKRLEGQADKLLLDVPCSGSGVLRRNPDAKYRITPDYVENLIRTQSEILNNYCRMVRVGGELIYVTCSIFPKENEDQINSFVHAHPGFQFIEDQHLWPSEFGYDGFYMARLKRIA